MGLTAIVLGAGAGGGVPQWNCNHPVSSSARAGDGRVFSRTQASVALSSDSRSWAVVNASPDLRSQIMATPALHPTGAPRGSPIATVVLTGAEIDQIAGLLSLRERAAFTIVATTTTLSTIADNPIFGALAPDVVMRQPVRLGEPFALAAGLVGELFSVPGKTPLYLEGDDPVTDAETDANVGLSVSDGTRTLAYVPGCARMTEGLLDRLSRANVILFDGTLFTDDEMTASGTGTKTGRRMGHMPVSGADGSMAALTRVPGRKIFTHINTTNPMLFEDSPERAQVVAAGWEVAFDGMEIVL